MVRMAAPGETNDDEAALAAALNASMRVVVRFSMLLR